VDQPLSATLFELRQLLESMRKVLQHLEVMAWCAHHQFLETIPSSYASISQWHTAVKERKSAAQDRAWLETPHNNAKLRTSQPTTLFIEEAFANLRLLEDGDEDEASVVDLPELSWLCQGPTA
jgi:E3 ubiquitin-protein ligase HOS1